LRLPPVPFACTPALARPAAPAPSNGRAMATLILLEVDGSQPFGTTTHCGHVPARATGDD